MKQVQIIKIDSGSVMIDNLQDYYQIPHCDALDNNRFIKNSDMEYVRHSEIEIENIPIQRIADHGVEHYIAVTHKVWEYLYLIENPVTAKSQEDKIEKLTYGRDHYRVKSNQKSLAIKEINNANLWCRIKWVFTGMDWYEGI